MPRIYDWISVKERLADLYLLENKELKEIMTIMSEEVNFTPRYLYLSFVKVINIPIKLKLYITSLRAYRERFAEWGFTKRQEGLHKNTELVAKVKELWTRNMSSTNMLRCLATHGWELSPTQLRNLRLHPTLRLLMGTAHTGEARVEAASRAEAYVQDHLISGQVIRYGRQYTLANIRLSGVFISQ